MKTRGGIYLLCGYDNSDISYRMLGYHIVLMYVSMHACMHVCMCACVHVCMYACMHACMYVCMYVCGSVYVYGSGMCVGMVCTFPHVHIHVFAC